MVIKIQVHPIDMEPTEYAAAENGVNLFTKTFHPSLKVLKFLSFSPAIRPLFKGRGSWRRYLSMLYSCMIILGMILNVVRMIPSFFGHKINYEFYVRLCLNVWCMRCIIHAIYMMKILSRPSGKKGELEGIIYKLDEDVDNAAIRGNKISVRKYTRRSNIVTAVFLGFILVSVILIFIAIFFRSTPLETVTPLLYPFYNQFMMKLAYACFNLYLNAAWISPILIYTLLCDAIKMRLTILESQLTCLSEQLCIYQHISKIRKMYLKVSSLVGRADDCFGPIVLVLYVFDIALFSLNLYISFFIAKSFLEQFVIWFWISGALMNLLVVSFDASQVVDKGKEVVEVLQKLETEHADARSNAELSLLLFHLSGEPIVMTIWKLIPLYKSIVVSKAWATNKQEHLFGNCWVFISLITYFTLLLQFK